MRLGSAQPETKGGTEDGRPHPIPHRQQERPAGLVWEVGPRGLGEGHPFPTGPFCLGAAGVLEM